MQDSCFLCTSCLKLWFILSLSFSLFKKSPASCTSEDLSTLTCFLSTKLKLVKHIYKMIKMLKLKCQRLKMRIWDWNKRNRNQIKILQIQTANREQMHLRKAQQLEHRKIRKSKIRRRKCQSFQSVWVDLESLVKICVAVVVLVAQMMKKRRLNKRQLLMQILRIHKDKMKSNIRCVLKWTSNMDKPRCQLNKLKSKNWDNNLVTRYQTEAI